MASQTLITKHANLLGQKKERDRKKTGKEIEIGGDRISRHDKKREIYPRDFGFHNGKVFRRIPKLLAFSKYKYYG